MGQALFVAAFDSQLKWCAMISKELAARGFDIHVAVPDTRSALSPQQVVDAGFDPADLEHLLWAELVERCLRSDVVVSALAGPVTRALSVDISSRVSSDATAPVLVSGWVGVIIEKEIAGYLDRSGTDIVAVNSTRDLRLFQEAAGSLRLPTDNLLLAGLPFLSGRAPRQRTGEIRRVLYADQPTVPTRATDRAYVYEELVEYARAFPDREVVLKPRHRLGEDTFHRMQHHPTTMVGGMDLPANFRFDYTPIHDQLPETDLLITMSSTASLEAIDQGCRVAYVLDLGIHERHGNQVFLGSGLLRTFSQIRRDEIGQPERGWMNEYFLGLGRSSTVIADRIDHLLRTGERPASAMWKTDYFGAVSRFHRDMFTTAGRRLARTPWQRRMQSHGRLVGSALQMAHWFSPPVVTTLTRRVRRRARTRHGAERKARAAVVPALLPLDTA